MERLTERTKYGIVGNNNGVENFPLYSLYDETYLDHGLIEQCFNKLAEYEDLEEQGLLLRLPCKIGDVLWWTNAFGDLCSSEVNSMFIEQGIDGIVIETWICNINGKEIGKTVFFTKEEAEQALAKMKEV